MCLFVGIIVFKKYVLCLNMYIGYVWINIYNIILLFFVCYAMFVKIKMYNLKGKKV